MFRFSFAGVVDSAAFFPLHFFSSHLSASDIFVRGSFFSLPINQPNFNCRQHHQTRDEYRSSLRTKKANKSLRLLMIPFLLSSTFFLVLFYFLIFVSLTISPFLHHVWRALPIEFVAFLYFFLFPFFFFHPLYAFYLLLLNR